MNRECFTKQEVVDLLLGQFNENFATEMSRLIVNRRSVDVIYSLATDSIDGLSDSQRQKVIFRAAYILETIYFHFNEQFIPFRERFIQDFPACLNESAKRHFTKIMVHLLPLCSLSLEECSAIAEACAQWVIRPRTRVAVMIGAVEVMLLLRGRVEWLNDVLEPILEILTCNPSPGMEVRLKRWRKENAIKKC